MVTLETLQQYEPCDSTSTRNSAQNKEQIGGEAVENHLLKKVHPVVSGSAEFPVATEGLAVGLLLDLTVFIFSNEDRSMIQPSAVKRSIYLQKVTLKIEDFFLDASKHIIFCYYLKLFQCFLLKTKTSFISLQD